MIDAVTPPPKQPVDFQQVLSATLYPDPQLSAAQQQKFINRYSPAALVLQFVYYFAMGDSLLAWLSLGCSVVFIFAPLLLIMPFWARRRAYRLRQWQSFAHFYAVQKKWDHSSWWLLAATLVLGLISLWLIGSTLLSSIKTVTGGNYNGSLTEQLQETVQQYQSILNQ